jgi:hypothetical protein
MWSRWRLRFGSTIAVLTLREMPRAIGLAKKGIGDVSIRSNTSFISRGDIAEPSAKCSQ